MLKKELRRKFGTQRKALKREEVVNLSLAIANKSLGLPIWDRNYYHTFLPIFKQNEIDTSFILSILQGKDKEVIIPKITGENGLSHFLLTDGTTLAENDWGIPEPVNGIPITPEHIDVVFVPLLIFDLNGNRVGYGKGFYDRFLEQCRPETIKVGLSLFDPINAITDISVTDITLNYCVTPKTVYTFDAS
ncbi:5-formyltetrahydrofolate cyclo-ligase [Maribacter sp. 2-571]|uniref:5-formyltetrahydrofolate cyclo-ligase n=1 Tax=Maribacter sp. 2-571 TaxID=3417569 RepID=UPI003D356012